MVRVGTNLLPCKSVSVFAFFHMLNATAIRCVDVLLKMFGISHVKDTIVGDS